MTLNVQELYRGVVIYLSTSRGPREPLPLLLLLLLLAAAAAAAAAAAELPPRAADERPNDAAAVRGTSSLLLPAPSHTAACYSSSVPHTK